MWSVIAFIAGLFGIVLSGGGGNQGVTNPSATVGNPATGRIICDTSLTSDRDGAAVRSVKLGSFSCFTPTPANSCTTTKADIVLVLDRTSSMGVELAGKRKIDWSTEAAAGFIDTLINSPAGSAGTIRVGLVTYGESDEGSGEGTTVEVRSPLTSSFSSVKSALSGITPENRTCIKCALNSANNQFTTHPNPGAAKIVILMTDGNANMGDTADPKAEAIATAENGRLTGMEFYVMGIGEGVDQQNFDRNVLEGIANNPDSKYLRINPDVNTWKQAYEDLFKTICGFN